MLSALPILSYLILKTQSSFNGSYLSSVLKWETWALQSLVTCRAVPSTQTHIQISAKPWGHKREAMFSVWRKILHLEDNLYPQKGSSPRDVNKVPRDCPMTIKSKRTQPGIQETQGRTNQWGFMEDEGCQLISAWGSELRQPERGHVNGVRCRKLLNSHCYCLANAWQPTHKQYCPRAILSHQIPKAHPFLIAFHSQCQSTDS